ncbi:MAG: alpha/beta hydrolase [Candidatus Enterosoma sp.]|nr:alpha/beta hydrolase [Bacilli bacterium]MDY5649497.1 alpha/beta hydrolase [Candidatus Enterosoma sp.]
MHQIKIYHYQSLFPKFDVIGFDYKSQNPWQTKKEFSIFYDQVAKGYDSVILIANSIGAFFSMNGFVDKNITKAFFISPIVNMEKLIIGMMNWSNITEEELCNRKEIITDFGEILSWEYLCYVRKHPTKWNIPTYILYGGNDNLTSRETISEFSKQVCATLTIMEDGEHWFHTDLQMKFLDNWIKKLIC